MCGQRVELECSVILVTGTVLQKWCCDAPTHPTAEVNRASHSYACKAAFRMPSSNHLVATWVGASTLAVTAVTVLFSEQCAGMLNDSVPTPTEWDGSSRSGTQLQTVGIRWGIYVFSVYCPWQVVPCILVMCCNCGTRAIFICIV